MSAGFVLFRMADRSFAIPLDEVREIVRLDGLQPLPGARPPLSGVVVLRGAPLPVLDVRDAERGRGDVLVVQMDGDVVGVAVDEVGAVLQPDELPEGDPPARALPPYVVGVRRGPAGPVLLVDLPLLLADTAAAADRASPPASASASLTLPGHGQPPP